MGKTKIIKQIAGVSIPERTQENVKGALEYAAGYLITALKRMPPAVSRALEDLSRRTGTSPLRDNSYVSYPCRDTEWSIWHQWGWYEQGRKDSQRSQDVSAHLFSQL